MKKINKTLIIVCSLIITTITMAFKPTKNGKVILMISLEVKDFTTWKTAFEAGAPVREKAGIKVISVCASVENQNQIVVIEEAENAQAAHDFLTILKAKQKEGNMDKLTIKLYDKAE